MYNDHKNLYSPFLGFLCAFAGAKTVVEVGVCKADTAVYLAKAAEHNKGIYLGFDIWDAHGLHKQFRQNGSKKRVEAIFADNEIENYALFQLDTRVHKERFRQILAEECPKGIDFAFIDGCHSYEGVKNDFDVIYPLLSPTGIIAMHDTTCVDGCREFALDLRTSLCDGTYDVIDLPFGGSHYRLGMTILSKRGSAALEVPIAQFQGSLSTAEQILQREKEWLKAERQRYERKVE